MAEDIGRSSGAAPGGPAGGPARRRILVVDDELGIRQTLRRILSRDHAVELAASGEEAQAMLEVDVAFDLLFFDLNMPAMSGVDLHAWLHARAPEVASRVVFMTGGAFSPRVIDYLERVGNPKVEKPFEVAGIRSLVAERLATLG